MAKNLHIPSVLKFFGLSVFLFFSIGFGENRQSDKVCEQIAVSIDYQYDNYFVDKDDVMELITMGGTRNLIGNWWTHLDLQQIEKRLMDHHFIKKAEVYRDLEGNMLVDVYQKRPIARVIRNGINQAYISEDGEVLPISKKFTARVVLISGDFGPELVKTQQINQTLEGKLMDLLDFIDQDDFWRAQISEVNIDRKGNVILYPQVTKQYIEFGDLNNLAHKFKKLKIFYQEILPQKGWNYYTKVNLKYQDQIICE